MNAAAGFALAPADAFASAQLHAANLAAFADYIGGPIQMPLDEWPAFIARQGIDLSRSRAAVVDGAVVAFVLACPRPEDGRWRIAVMGALPSARGSGAAPALIGDLFARASAEGMAFAELECFDGNERALRLYRRCGFEVACPLNGWKLPAAGAAAAPVPAALAAREVHAVDRATALAWLAETGGRIGWLPFQNTARSLSVQVRPFTFWQCGEALLVFSTEPGVPTTLHVVLDRDPALRGAERLAHALRRAHPDAWAPPLLRDDLGGAALGRAGFERQALNQVLMRRAL